MAYVSGQKQTSLWRTTRQILLGVIVLVCLTLFVLWRIDSPRVERLRMTLADVALPSMEWTTRPAARFTNMVQDFQSYVRVYEQNEELRRELQTMSGWREAALQLEQRNARLRALNNVQLSPRATFITGEIMADSAGPFSRSGLDVLAGQVIVAANGQLRLRLAADYDRLRFVRILNHRPQPTIHRPGGLIADEPFFFAEEPE